MPPSSDPGSEEELLLRARALAGRSIAEVAGALGLPVPPDQRHHKGWVGHLVEKALGVTAGSAPVPDFTELGVELKTLPLDAAGVPTETTFVSSLDFGDPLALGWEGSSVRKKLARILWLPVQADPAVPLAERRFGNAVLWSPTPEEEARLRADFDEIAGMIEAGFVERVTAHRGKCLQLRPKGANARQLRWMVDAEEGGLARTPPRAFYLRRSFTAELVRRHWSTGV